MAAHIRKTNPRNDLGGRGPNGTVNRFRILRRGIPYVSKDFAPSKKVWRDVWVTEPVQI
jgi:deferrochelatase/peroxidase EfeB